MAAGLGPDRGGSGRGWGVGPDRSRVIPGRVGAALGCAAYQAQCDRTTQQRLRKDHLGKWQTATGR